MNNLQERNQSREGFQDVQQTPAPAPAHMNGNLQQGPVSVQEPIEAPRPVETWPVKVRLIYKPIRDNNGREINELIFREPTGGDINRCGNPCRIDQNGDVVIDERKMHLIMANLSGILSPLLDAMHPRDWNSCAYRLRSFFLPDLEAW